MIHLKDTFKELYDEWFVNKSYWFDKNPDIDKYLSDKYFGLVSNIKDYHKELNVENIPTLIGAIIAFDQIPRHFKRFYENKECDCKIYTYVAVKISLHVMELCSKNLEVYDSISPIEWCFILLPIRHTENFDNIFNVIKFVLKKYNGNCSDGDRQVYKRFLQATIENIYKKVTSNMFILPQKYIHDIDVNKYNQWEYFGNVLHHIPQQPIIFDIPYDNHVIKQFQNEMKYVTNDNIMVSISGGVDSCLCLYLIKQMMPFNEIVAVHINYNNRLDSKEELEFVQKYCAILNVKLFYRTIQEIQRIDCHQKGLRDFYEEITRNIRFDTYKQVAQERFNDTNTLVVLGHNKDDCFENIITNISLKHNYDNLAGVTRLSTLDDIHFWRPLLEVRKSDIIHLAMYLKIPFLHTSTPSWSARGKIRDIILPSLQNINQDIMRSFFDLKDYIMSSDTIMNTYVLPCILGKFQHKDNTIIYESSLAEFISNIYIWSKIFHDSKFLNFFQKQISHKSLNEFIKYLERFKENFNTIHTNKKIKYILKPDVYSIIYKTTNNTIYIEFVKIIKK